jgi:hypothetical protein
VSPQSYFYVELHSAHRQDLLNEAEAHRLAEAATRAIGQRRVSAISAGLAALTSWPFSRHASLRGEPDQLQQSRPHLLRRCPVADGRSSEGASRGKRLRPPAPRILRSPPPSVAATDSNKQHPRYAQLLLDEGKHPVHVRRHHRRCQRPPLGRIGGEPCPQRFGRAPLARTARSAPAPRRPDHHDLSSTLAIDGHALDHHAGSREGAVPESSPSHRDRQARRGIDVHTSTRPGCSNCRRQDVVLALRASSVG